MSCILVYVAIQGGAVKRSSLEVLTHCRQLAAANDLDVEAVIAHPEASSFVDTVQRYGAKTVYTVEHPIFANHLNAPLLDALHQAIEQAQPRLVAFASTEAVKDVLGALAVRTQAAVLPDVSDFNLTDGRVTARRPVMASKLIARVEVDGEPVLVSVRAGSYAAEEAPVEARAEAVAFDVEEDSLAQQLREVVQATSEGGVDLAEADVVVSAGRGVRDEEGKRLVEELASVLSGAVGATRAVVESGLFPATAQIGQTGKVVSPSLYFAVGISGAIQHVAGMANSRVIVAINKDPDAPIFKVATYGLVGDLYKILPPLIEEMRKAKS